MDDWFRLLRAAIENDKVAMKESSLKLGYLTGEENEVSQNFSIVYPRCSSSNLIPYFLFLQEMLEAHLKSMSLLGRESTTPSFFPLPLADSASFLSSSLSSLPSDGQRSSLRLL